MVIALDSRLDVDKPFGRHLRQETNHIAFTSFRVDIELRHESVAYVAHAAGLLDQAPDPGPNIVHAVVLPSLESQNHRFVAQLGGDMLTRGPYRRSDRDAPIHGRQGYGKAAVSEDTFMRSTASGNEKYPRGSAGLRSISATSHTGSS